MTQLSLDWTPLPSELQERIDAARRSGKLTEAAAAVLDLLTNEPSGPHAGRERAMQISLMQGHWRRTGQYVWPERSVKAAVKELLEEHRVPIGSSRVAGHSGYFLLSCVEDVAAAERPLRGEVLSLLKRLRTINPKSDFVRHLAGQEELR